MVSDELCVCFFELGPLCQCTLNSILGITYLLSMRNARNTVSSLRGRQAWALAAVFDVHRCLRKTDSMILYHHQHRHHHPEGVVYRTFCLNSSTSAVSEIASRRWWCIESLPISAFLRTWGVEGRPGNSIRGLPNLSAYARAGRIRGTPSCFSMFTDLFLLFVLFSLPASAPARGCSSPTPGVGCACRPAGSCVRRKGGREKQEKSVFRHVYLHCHSTFCLMR